MRIFISQSVFITISPPLKQIIGEEERYGGGRGSEDIPPSLAVQLVSEFPGSPPVLKLKTYLECRQMTLY